MSRPVTFQPGPGQRANEHQLVIPAPPPRQRLAGPPAEVRRSLRASIRDAVSYAVMQGAGASYVAPFVILGKSDLWGIAAISAVPSIATGFLLLWAAKITDQLRARKRIIVACAAAQTLTWVIFAIAVFLPFTLAYWIMLVTFVVHVGLGSFLGPAWQSLMGDLVPPNRRGRYFGLRNGFSVVAQTAAFFAAGWWLTFSEDTLTLFGISGRTLGFFAIFAVAGVARLSSTYYLTKLYEPEYCPSRGDTFSLLDFIRRAPRAHFGRFVLYSMMVNFAFGLNGPFYGWYLLDQLGYSPGTWALITTAGLIAGALAQPWWGRLIDRMGSKYVLAIGGNAIIFIPVALLLCSQPWHFFLAAMFDGLASAAFTMAVGNYFFDVVTPPKRARCVAYNTFFVSMGAAMGAFVGAALAAGVHMPLHVGTITVGHPFALVLIASTLVRVLASILLLSTFDEFRLSRPVFQTPA